ncbi:MAG: ABC transporter permease subunit [Bacteroidales bacterium]|nr:ABC transporter permease subunit [Bacteroidales bacterium]
MKTTWVITRRELNSYFDSLTAYIMLILFLGFSGLFTWILGNDIFMVGQASLRSFFGVSYWTLFIFIPALTMRLIAEENRSGTIELLLTKPVTDRELVWGKFLAALLLVVVALAFTFPYVITVASIGNLDQGAVFCGYLGLILLSAVYISIGIYASSITGNQIVAFLVAIFIALFFQIVFDVLTRTFSGFAGEVFNFLSVSTHFESMSRGVVDTKDLIYFLSLIVLFMKMAEDSLSKRNS